MSAEGGRPFAALAPVRAFRIRVFVPDSLATGDAATARAMVFAQYAALVRQPVVDATTAVEGGTLVDVREADYGVTKKKRAPEAAA